MKKSFVLIFAAAVIILTACSSTVSIDNGKIKENTIALNKDGEIQMGIVEDFSKEYYNFEELEAFIEDSIRNFCEKNGEKAVSLKYLKKENNKVLATLAFDNIKSYAGYNGEDVSFMKLAEAINAGILPDQVENVDKSGAVELSTLNSEDYYVAVWKGRYQIMVEGKIEYYTNGIILDDNMIQSDSEDATVVIFR